MLRTLRASLAIILIISMTLIGIPVQAIVRTVMPKYVGLIPKVYHRFLCRMLGIRVQITGQVPDHKHASAYPLIVSNHTSWLDIVVMGSITELRFIARADMAAWPVVGILTKLQNTVFVDRNRRTKTKDTIGHMRYALTQAPLVLFAEGTTSDGNQLLPLKPALLGAVIPSKSTHHPQSQETHTPPLTIVPALIRYKSLGGLPVGQSERAKLAWYGDMDLATHAGTLLKIGAIDVDVTFLEALSIFPEHDRKAMVKDLEEKMRTVYQNPT